MSGAGTLWLVPVPVAPGDWRAVMPAGTVERACALDYFVAERAKTARAFLRQWPLVRPLQEIEIAELDPHAPTAGIDALLAPILAGRDGGLMSEAGCPGVADPGALLVAAAHRAGVRVVPLVGPSAILLTLMASGLEGQRFAFHGYLPTDRGLRLAALADLERRSARDRETQLWIETPYRAQAMLEAVLAGCRDRTRLALGCDLTAAAAATADRAATGAGGAGEWVGMRSVADWRRAPVAIDGRLAVFALLAEPIESAESTGGARGGPAAPRPRGEGAGPKPFARPRGGSAKLQRRRG